ncbi:golgin candidate 4 isoform X2 [Phoenix dactylifera]|uniref:Golgin candidate 4 isoform X2 n=1 Tax=Phoenix dactylifera TaxID=42345 RepID=A0A8B8ZME6_PHODC|nr:golgin candidate 4 isoform X2 [Phoenix dactylifera]
MRNSITTYRESLSRIASEVLDDEEELENPQTRGAVGEDSPASGRRFSRRRSSRFRSPTGSPVANGTDSGSQDEEQLSKLCEENGSLRKSLEAKNALGHTSKDESLKTLSNSSDAFKSTADQSPIRRQRHTAQENSNSPGNHAPQGHASTQDGYSNSRMQPNQFDAVQRKRELKFVNSQGNGKEYPDLLEENRSLAAAQARLESEIKQLKAQLDNECENATIMKRKLGEEHQLNESSWRELHDLKMDKEKTSIVMKELQKELNEKISELSRLQAELSRRDIKEESNESLGSLKNAIRTLEKENAKLKVEKNELEANLQLCMKSASEKNDADDLDSQNRKSSNSHEVTEEMTLSIRKLEGTLKDTCKERDKALQELARLKQHILEKELEDSDKMDEDSKIIEELRANCEYQRAHILQLEKALKQEISKKEEIKKIKSDELLKSNEIINDLKQKLANCMSTVESKDLELLNLQTALGQYYAESEARERLGRDLAMEREESTKLSESLKVAHQGLEMSNREKEEMAAKLMQAERMLSESKHSIQKLEEENSKLRRALEQSMTRLNRMSLDSDNYVDRRIVIKLLVTYFQRNHSKEVLDLMVRMLGFSEEEKQRIGFAQHSAGKGVVRGVLGLPGRLVGGILGGSSPETSSHASSENQSFADMWVDYLLKESEERGRRESSEAAGVSASAQERSTSSTRMQSAPEKSTSGASSFPTVQISRPPSKQNQHFKPLDAEFATVPLTSSVHPSDSSFSRLPQRY